MNEYISKPRLFLNTTYQPNMASSSMRMRTYDLDREIDNHDLVDLNAAIDACVEAWCAQLRQLETRHDIETEVPF